MVLKNFFSFILAVLKQENAPEARPFSRAARNGNQDFQVNPNLMWARSWGVHATSNQPGMKISHRHIYVASRRDPYLGRAECAQLQGYPPRHFCLEKAERLNSAVLRARRRTFHLIFLWLLHQLPIKLLPLF